MDFNRFNQSREFPQKLVYVSRFESMNQTLLRSLQHIFIFQEKRGCCTSHKPTTRDQPKDCISCA